MMRLEVAIVLGLCLGVVNTQRTLDAVSQDRNSDPMLTALSGDSGNTMDTRGPIPPMDERQPEICEQDISGRKGISDDDLWSDGVVPFEFHESIENDVMSDKRMSLVLDAMTYWSNHTCISFRPRQSTDRSFLIFRSDINECSSRVGIFSRDFTGQNVNLGTDCWEDDSTIAHEIGHAIGFYHEHQRRDRDEHVKIFDQNVKANETDNFCLEDDFDRGVPYDLTSIMHYPQWAFSMDEYNKSTIVTRDPFLQRLLFKSNMLSFRDRRLANLMYQCTDETSDVCRNGGYLRVTAGYVYAGEYSCDCPPNTEGEFCQIKTRDSYYEELPCGGNVIREGVIKTPGYPDDTQEDISCAWRILAPTGHRVELTIENFKFSPRYNQPNSEVHNKCVQESVEFRLDASNEYVGSFYCGSDLKRDDLLVSRGNWAVIIVNAKAGSNLRARVSFVPIIDG